MNKDEVENAKRQLNSVYGKSAMNPNVTPKIPFIDKDDVILRLHRVVYIDTDSIQVPDAIKDIIDDKELSAYVDKLTRYLRECL